MRVVPPILPPRATGSEAEIFLLLAQIQSSSAVALCSLNLSDHEYKKWGEIDFVVVSEQGLLVLEVKGGQVYCDRGLWRYESRGRARVERAESPMAQASSAYFALRKHLYHAVGKGLVDDAVTGFGVVLARTSVSDAETRGLLGGPEMPRSLIGTREDVETADTLQKLMEGLLDHWRARMSRLPRRWTAEEVSAVVNALRPWFDRVAPLSVSVARVREEQLALTAEQYHVLDFSHSADRVLVTGGAGCGKTMLAVECLRREHSHDPVLITGTESLARHLRASLATDASRIYSFGELSSMPRDRRRTYGSLIVDEGQQLTNAASVAVLSSVLQGGIERGRWRWFCDPNNQVLPSSNFDHAQQEVLRRNAFPGTLTKNCRTTPQIAHTVQVLTGASIGESTTKGQGPDVSFARGLTNQHHVSSAATIVLDWLQDPEIKPGDIVLLSPKQPSEWSVPEIAKRAGLPWCFWRPGWENSKEHSGHLAASTVEDFRGMESPFVLLCDMDASIKDPACWFYLGMTRANFGLMVVADAEVVQRSVAAVTSSRILL